MLNGEQLEIKKFLILLTQQNETNLCINQIGMEQGSLHMPMASFVIIRAWAAREAL